MRPNHSRDRQSSVVVAVGFGTEDECFGVAVVVASSHPPNQPGVLQVDVDFDVVVTTVFVWPGSALVVVIVLTSVVVVGSLHPNQPGVLQVEVDVEDVLLELGVVVVDSSRQPHHPGVLQVSVRVRVDVEVLLELLVVDELLLSKNFQLKQSTHSVSSSQAGTVSYFSSTSLMTLTILWVPMPTRQPRSPTVSYVQVLPV